MKTLLENMKSVLISAPYTCFLYSRPLQLKRLMSTLLSNFAKYFLSSGFIITACVGRTKKLDLFVNRSYILFRLNKKRISLNFYTHVETPLNFR
jgi:hypothetical protein